MLIHQERRIILKHRINSMNPADMKTAVIKKHASDICLFNEHVPFGKNCHDIDHFKPEQFSSSDDFAIPELISEKSAVNFSDRGNQL